MKQAKIINLVGRRKDTHAVESIRDFLIIRKGIEKKHIRGYSRAYKCRMDYTKYAVMVSSPYIFNNELIPQYANVWFHPFRNPSEHLKHYKKGYLFSESDFIDPLFVPCFSKNKIKWDYFYFTIGGGDGIEFKGFKVFLDILPSLANAGLNGVVVVYGKHAKTSKSHYSFMKDHNVKIIRNGLSYTDVGGLMSRCKFGIFPNLTDCSPRMLTEAIVRNVPVLVNENILGGWKYINDNTGVFFNTKNINNSLEKVLNNNFSPRNNFMQNYGFINSSVKFSNLLRENWPEIFSPFDMVAFSDFKKIMNLDKVRKYVIPST